MGLKFNSPILILEIHDLHFMLYNQKVTLLHHHKNKRPLNFNDLSLKNYYLKNGAEKMTRSLYIYFVAFLALLRCLNFSDDFRFCHSICVESIWLLENLSVRVCRKHIFSHFMFPNSRLFLVWEHII